MQARAGRIEMFNSEKIGRIALAAIGTLIFTTVSVGAAVGPAQNIEADTMYVMADNAAQNTAQARG
jgi:L-cystine uptake protein TcyP (sodium:dicarboxylate symporter family)